MNNVRHIIIFAVFLISILIGCEKSDPQIRLSPDSDLIFNGTFKTIDSGNATGTVSLSIKDGYYHCTTNLPYGNGAGIIEIEKNKVDFIDTLFFVIPALYGPSYILSGQHDYRFDGENLSIWKGLNNGTIKYDLNLIVNN